MNKLNIKSKVVLKIVLCALFTALITIGAFIKVPISIVPITLQCMLTMLAGMLLGPKYGTISVLLYIVLGLLGVPVFAKGGGIMYVFEPTFGYIIGFVFATFATGVIVHGLKNNKQEVSFKRLICAGLIGLIIIYACGMLYFYLITVYYLKTTIDAWTFFMYCFLFTIPGDILCVFIGSIIVKRVLPIFEFN